VGFSVYLADDPELEDDAAESDHPAFSTNRLAMAALREEMGAQGMLAFIPGEALLWNQGDSVGSEEIAAALAVARPEPIIMHLEGDREFWRQWLDFLQEAVRHGGIVVW
jgi:hypothetical protein